MAGVDGNVLMGKCVSFWGVGDFATLTCCYQFLGVGILQPLNFWNFFGSLQQLQKKETFPNERKCGSPWFFLGKKWGSVKIPCWPACLESLGHRSGWGPHRFTWFGYMVLISVLICKGIPLSWSRSDLVSAWHLGGLRCPWPPSSNASPQRWSSTAQKKKLTAHTPANPPAPFFWKGRATVVCFSF